MPAEHEKGKQKRRIFCVITQGELGGAQQFVSQLAQHINPELFDFHVVWGASSSAAFARSLPAHVTHATAQHLVRHIMSPIEDVRAIFELRRLMRMYKPDVVLCISSKAGFVGSLAAHGIRDEFPELDVIYRIGGWTFNDPWPRWKQRLFVALERFSARWKDTIIVNNAHDLEQARALRITPRKELACIHNGLDPFLPFMTRDEARTALNQKIPTEATLLQPDWWVGTIANLYPTKDIATFIRAASRVEGHVRFVVIGDGEQRAQLEQAVQEAALTHRFFFLGSIPEAWKYIPGFDVFVLASVKEGFPWALLEAMAARVPSIATRVGAVPEMIPDESCGIVVEPGDSDAIAEAIVHLLGHDKKRQDIAIAAHQRVINTFSLRVMIDAYERLFSRSVSALGGR